MIRDTLHEVNGEEDENSAVEAAGSALKTGSRLYGLKEYQKQFRKRQIKRKYAKSYRKEKEKAEKTLKTGWDTARITAAAAKKLAELAARNAHFLIVASAVMILLLMIMTAVSSCAAMFGGGISDVMAGTYQSLPAEIDKADASMTLKEIELQEEIDRIETDHPGYDEYNYNLAAIGHDPAVLINYLSAKNVEFTAADAEAEIQALFDGMYDLKLNAREEIRKRKVKKTRHKKDPDTGEELDELEEYEAEEEYKVKILDVTLTAVPLENVISGSLTGETADLYKLYQETDGARQEFYTPLDLDWKSCIKSYYGYRKDPVTGSKQFHRGLDISVPEGTNVYASQSGTVAEAGFNDEYGNYIVIEEGGYMTKYAHLESLNVNAGDKVRHGQLIGKTGSNGSVTGSHLHIECLYNGEYFNPLFYFENGEGSLYDSDAPEAVAGTDVKALLDEAAKYLGYPYVWGGSNPKTSFDCSGFVCWVLTNSGFANVPRTTAQGIYNKCSPISAGDAEPGDLIFFTGTYKSGNPVSHVGIYCGNGIMIHAGDPIKYSNINTTYWQSHFYGYGRMPH